MTRILLAGIACIVLAAASAAQNANKLEVQIKDGPDVKSVSSDLFPASEALYDVPFDKAKGTTGVSIILTKMDDLAMFTLGIRLSVGKAGTYTIVKGNDVPSIQLLGSNVKGLGDLTCYPEAGSKIFITSFPTGPGAVSGSFEATCTDNKKQLHVTGNFNFAKDK
ncbi:MAG: hypothetical protein JO053_16265 [Acidobacteria bacterium]|nr:hypothetical protein [Acidobacteriota bacterium]